MYSSTSRLWKSGVESSSSPIMCSRYCSSRWASILLRKVTTRSRGNVSALSESAMKTSIACSESRFSVHSE
ncbi:hypothetical protein HYQ46_005311 [Verticillium longisporum]|nr:hypothetical protein HYQ46_005311 [Verticillium longisporum]